MKKILGLILLIVILIIPFTVWRKDIENDRQKTAITLDKVPLYSIWECGLDCGAEKTIRIIPSGQSLSILRIRIAKDFMALEIKYNDDLGWLIYDGDKLKIKQ
jgi:hypothetical protein